MPNPSWRKTRVRLVSTIYQGIEQTKCRPRPRLVTGDGSEPRRGLGPTTTSPEKSQKGSSRNHELGALFQQQLQQTPMGNGGRRLLPPTSGRKRDPVKESKKGTQEEKSREDTAGGGGEPKTVVQDLETVDKTISDLRSQLDCAAQTIVAKDNDLERLDKEKEKLQQANDRCKQRMRQIGGMLWKEGV